MKKKLVNVRSYLTNLSTQFRRPKTASYIGRLVNAVGQEVEIPEDAIMELKRHIDEVDVSLEKNRDLGDSAIIIIGWLNHFGGSPNQAEKPEGVAFIKTQIRDLLGGYSNRRIINYVGRLLRAIRDDAWVDQESMGWIECHLVDMDKIFSEKPPEIMTMDHITTAMWINGFIPQVSASAA